MRATFVDPASSRIRPFWRGQLFLFDPPPAAGLTSRESLRLLLVFVLLEVLVRPLGILATRGSTLAGSLAWPLVQVTILTGLACWLVSRFAGVRLSRLGLRAWRNWSRTEKFYFLQTLPLAIVVFAWFRWAGLELLWARNNPGQIALFVFVPQMLWGFYQEFLYRGVLQTVVVRRWGVVKGILVGNLVFTFGPLHAYHFSAARGNPAQLWIFAAIFAIGLLFAVLYQRSGNLALVGILHGLGDWFIDGLGRVARMAR